MFVFQSVLFQGDALLQAIADDQIIDGQHARISGIQNANDPAVGKVQTALLDNDPGCLPVHGADGTYGGETARAVHQFKIDVLGVDPSTVIDDVGPLTVQRLDQIRAAVEGPAGAPILRRDIWTLESVATPFDPVTLAYAKAVGVMQGRPVTDRTSWLYQAGIHGSPRPQPGGAHWNQCQHFGWFFLPWHRMYLYFFERIVRAAAGDPPGFAIPYWDYHTQPTMPPAFRLAPTLPDGTSNPLFLAAPLRRKAYVDGAALPTTATSELALNLPNFAPLPVPGFGGGQGGPAHFLDPPAIGGIEQTPHNVVHGQIGGPFSPTCDSALMNNPNCAALDPIFWLHHSNIDRLWNRWLATPGNALPPDNGWRDQTFTFADETGAEVPMSVADVLDSVAQLGYAYEEPLVPVARLGRVGPPQPPPPPGGPPELIAATEAPLDLAGITATSMTVPAGGEALFESLVQGGGRVTLNVDNIEAVADGAPGDDFAVFLEVPGADGPQRHHVGNLTFFGFAKINDPDQPNAGASGFRHAFDVTPFVDGLDPAQLAALSVSFEPIEPVPPDGAADREALLAEVPRDAPATARVGSVSLFAG